MKASPTTVPLIWFTMTPIVFTLVLTVLGPACRRSTDPLPQVNKPAPTTARVPKPEFTILERDLSSREAMFVVAMPDSPRSTQEALLRVADYLAQDSEPGVVTLVLFRDPRQPAPSRRLYRAEQFSLSFAFAKIHPIAHVRQVETGRIFN
jgi:hypothetical protein